MSCWEWLNLSADRYREPVQPPSICGLIYAGQRHMLSGPPESTKTLVAAIISLTAQRQGELVAHIDLEMGAHRTRALLEDLGATHDELRELQYTEPAGPPSPRDIEYVIGNGLSLAVIDAAAGAYGVSGLDDHARKDVEQFAQKWIEPLYRGEVATLLIDHVTKSTDTRGKWAIGSERKAGQVDVHLGLEVVGKQLTRGGSTLVKVRVHKDRSGWLPRPYAAQLELRSDPDTHRITWEWRTPDQDETGDTWRPTGLMQKVSQFLARQTEPVSRNTVERSIGGTAQYVRRRWTSSCSSATSR